MGRIQTGFRFSLCPKFGVSYAIYFEVVTGFFHATHSFVMIRFVPSNFEITQYRKNPWTGHENVFAIAYTKSLHAQCDLDLQASDRILAPDTLSCHDNNL